MPRVPGTTVFSGMLRVGLFLTPTFYVVLRKLSNRFWGGEWWKPRMKERTHEGTR